MFLVSITCYEHKLIEKLEFLVVLMLRLQSHIPRSWSPEYDYGDAIAIIEPKAFLTYL